MLHHNLLTIKATPSEWIVRFTPTNCINGKIAKFPMRPPNLSKLKDCLLRSSHTVHLRRKIRFMEELRRTVEKKYKTLREGKEQMHCSASQ